MSEQLEINRPERPRCMRGIAGQIGKIDINRKGNTQTITGQGFEARFSLISGTLQSLTYDGRNVIVPGHGPTLDAFRAYLNNDNWVYGQWFANGLYNLKHKVTACETFTDRFGNAVLSFTIESQAPRGGRMTGGNGNASGTYAIDESQSAIFGPDDFRFTTNQIWMPSTPTDPSNSTPSSHPTTPPQCSPASATPWKCPTTSRSSPTTDADPKKTMPTAR